jgi:hypothetical protein
MMTKEEIKQCRLEFWSEFDKYTIGKKKRSRKPAKWIMNNTGIKQLKLKFDFDEKRATVGIDVETRNLDKRIDVYGKLERLKSKLEKSLGQSLIWELEHILPTGKSISRAYLELANVSIYRKEDWPRVMDFFYKNMVVLEKVFEEYKDYLKYSETEEQ